jgi:uncharacterized protein
MSDFFDMILQPWPWYVAGPLVGLTVPMLLILGNKNFGISSSLRHLCAMCIPGNIPFFNYDWKKELWNLLFVCGIFFGGLIASQLLSAEGGISVDPRLQAELSDYGIRNFDELYPVDLFSFSNILTLRGSIILIVGGFLVGFGTRYAGGCTSGHSITGLSMLQMPSLVATICFMIGGIVVANFVLPYILRL